MGKGRTNTKSRQQAASTKKNEPKPTKNDEPLINFQSESESSSSDTEKVVNNNGKVATRPPAGTSGKRQRVSTEKDMEVDFATSSSSKNSSTSLENNTTLCHKNITQPQSGAVVQTSDDFSTLDVENQSRSEISQISNQIVSGMDVDPLANKEIDDTISRDLNASRHAHPKNEDLMDDADTYDITTFKAAIPFVDLKKENETKKQLLNRITDVMLDQFTSFIKISLIKKGTNATLLIVVLLADNEQHQALLNNDWSGLRVSDTSDVPVFHNYNPVAINEAIRQRSLNVRNIPLRITKQNITTFFGKFGIIDQIKMNVRHNSLFQTASIIYQDSASVDPFMRGKWGLFMMGECVRIFPARLNKVEYDYRSEHTAVLRNLPRRTQATDLMRLFSSVNAAAMSLPRFANENPKTWVYINFTSIETMQAALESAPVLNGRQLIWAKPEDVKTFCPRCSSPAHRAQDCDDAASRGQKPTPKAILNTYKKHGIVTAATKQATQEEKRQRSQSRQRSTSRLRSQAPPDISSSSSSSSSTSSPPINKSVSYADSVKNNNLNSSIHAPPSSSRHKGKGKDIERGPESANPLALSQDTIKQLLNTVQQATTELNKLTHRINQWDAKFAAQQEAIDFNHNRVLIIEQHLNLTPADDVEMVSSPSTSPSRNRTRIDHTIAPKSPVNTPVNPTVDINTLNI